MPHEEAPGGGWLDFTLEGNHAFAGIDFAGGPSLPIGSYAGSLGVGGAFLFAFKGGGFLGHTELGIELSPMTFISYDKMKSHFQLMGYFCYYAELAGNFYWPIRMGAGIIAANLNDRVALELRGDFLGLAYKLGHIMLDAHLPSFRFMSEFQDLHILMWEPGVGASYVF